MVGCVCVCVCVHFYVLFVEREGERARGIAQIDVPSQQHVESSSVSAISQAGQLCMI